jgi:hypothetical protein
MRSPETPDALQAQWQLVRRRLAPGERVVLPMRTGSMTPLIPAGSEIEIAGLRDAARLDMGDVVVFRRGERLVAHRLLFGWGLGDQRWFVERGDGTSPVGRIRAHDVLGIVVAVQRPDGEREDLTTAVARRRGRAAVRRSLRRWLAGIVRGRGR